jgi:hypothetical protein
MKTQMIALLLTVATLTARAGNDGPQAAPSQPKQIVAQVVTGGGFAPDYVPVRSTVDILSTGEVQATDSYRDGHTAIKLIATLAPDVLTNIKSLAESIRAGEMVDPNPSSPGCMDAPSTIYYAIKNDGTKIAIAQNEQCKQYERKEANSGDYVIKNVLQGMISLAQLKDLPKNVVK